MTGVYIAPQNEREVLSVTDLGGGLKLLYDKKMQLTHKRANEIITETTEFGGDRSLRSKHVKRLTDAMARGTFHWEWVKIVLCRYNGNVYRMNGQHTCWARLNRPADEPSPCSVMMYEAETEYDMRQLYASIDRNAPRTKSNVIDSYLAGTEEYGHVKRATLARLPQGYTLWKWETVEDRRNNDGDDVAFLLLSEDYKLATQVAAFLDAFINADTMFLFRAPVIAAMFATFHKAPTVAHSFWEAVASGIGFSSVDDPRNRLGRFLQRNTLGGSPAGVKSTVAQEEMFQACINAWNAFRQDRTLKVLKVVSTGGRPKVK